MKFSDYLRRFKPAYALYNFFYPQHLRHNVEVFERFNIHKNYFESISSEDFKNINNNDLPWLDVGNSSQLLPSRSDFLSLNDEDREAILHWSEKGYAIIRHFYSPVEVAFIRSEVENLVATGKVKPKQNGKIMFAIHQSPALRKKASSERMEKILSLLMGKRVRLFQSINFNFGSQQSAHSDSIHMTTFPAGYLIAVWIALEEITINSGPLFYYSGSHKLPYIMNRDFQDGRTKFLLGKEDYPVYEKKIDEIISTHFELKKKHFLAHPGDILIWHANLLHGGEKIHEEGTTRKSMVMHYFCEDVICYHEITERPAIIKSE